MTPFGQQYARLVSYLAKLYDVPFFQRGEVRYPIAFFPPAPQQIDDLDSVLGPLPSADDALEGEEELAFYNHAVLATYQNRTPGLYNGITYAFKRLRPAPLLKVEARLGRYYDMLATCGALEQELRDANIHETLRLPGRTLLHRAISAQRVITEGAGRSAALGVACLTVFAHPDGGHRAILARRTSRNATDPGFFHVLPAFIFQPGEAGPAARDWSVRHQVEREYLEELFGMEEDPQGQQDFAQQPAWHELQAMLGDGRASLHLTGVVVNFFSLRAEICSLLLIRDPQWWARCTAPDSATPFNAASEAQGGRLTIVPIEDDAALLAHLPPDVHAIMPPQGAAALWIGIDLARRLLA